MRALKEKKEMTEIYSDEDRRRHIKSKIATSSPMSLKYLRNSFERKLKHGYVSQELHDFTMQEIEKVNGG